MRSAFLTIGLGLGMVYAQTLAPLWAQCGGIGFTGPTVCVEGATCVYLNAYHFQCLATSSLPTTTSTPLVEPTAPPGSLSIKTSCVNTTIQQEWFVGWCLTGEHKKRIQSSVYLGNKVKAVNGDLTWQGDSNYGVACYSCQLNNLTELSCICPAYGKPLYRTAINLEDHIANYQGHLLNDLAGPPVVPTRSRSTLFPGDVNWAYDAGDTSCFDKSNTELCEYLTWGPGCDGVASERNTVPNCYYDFFDLGNGGSAMNFKSMAFYATDGAYKFELWDNLECSGPPSATITPSEYAQCVPFRKPLVAWAVIPQWNADL
ncbi:hypothetical protein H072_11047 [Dactylellina haptotyla CBS 200.50]|uniref:CBM1 domain-containing protein n=1 Tax=Dactylellina haptotyla (strain CBS 200.50) TaxID=1284197 RepID=S8B8X2_DACHA|nr:hypothetical protein H072_11047 [Dactylellina haptotyla CBS 200.50]